MFDNIPLGAASLTVSDDPAANDLTEALELAAKPVLVDVPAQVADEQVLDALLLATLLSLGLLDDGLGNLLSLALLGGSLCLVALGVVGGIVRVGGSSGLLELACF